MVPTHGQWLMLARRRRLELGVRTVEVILLNSIGGNVLGALRFARYVRQKQDQYVESLKIKPAHPHVHWYSWRVSKGSVKES